MKTQRYNYEFSLISIKMSENRFSRILKIIFDNNYDKSREYNTTLMVNILCFVYYFRINAKTSVFLYNFFNIRYRKEFSFYPP